MKSEPVDDLQELDKKAEEELDKQAEEELTREYHGAVLGYVTLGPPIRDRYTPELARLSPILSYYSLKRQESIVDEMRGDSKAIKVLTRWLVGLTLGLALLTVALIYFAYRLDKAENHATPVTPPASRSVAKP